MYYPLTDECRLPHQHFVISPIHTVSELPLRISNTMLTNVDKKRKAMLTKNEKHYDGLIFKSQGNLYLCLKRSNIFDNQIRIIYQEPSVFNGRNHQVCFNL